ncbi:protein of unknown function [Clostridium collagenovorans DSM 3089]|uniref:Macrophage migration inhibitory factor (MIF) n=1 Tax=Clostridium collagenovorans DSM 3089 TaxID=1121306 RepID=A0A1M5XXK4_9CLOT|nr:DUF1904 domain-containing protein [Clostridium collagenovorans]SHI04537.1 protein of unknown function [Clostridium collagenovorans DSM 3089]
MPQLIMKSVEIEKVCTISKEMIDELETLLECPRNYFTIECVNSTYVMDGKVVKSYPIIEVALFDRGQETQDEIAKIITKHLNNVGYKDVDIIFTALDTNKYYENGEHF